MKVKFRFVLFFSITILLFVSLFVLVSYALHRQNNQLRNSLVEQFSTRMQSKSNRQSAHFKHLIKKYVEYPELYSALKDPHNPQIEKRLNTTFSVSQVDQIILVNDAYSKSYSYNRSGKDLKLTPLSPRLFSKIKSEDPIHFFSYDDNILIEYSALPFKEPNQSSRDSYAGYLLFAREWDQTLIQAYEQFSDSEVNIRSTLLGELSLDKDKISYKERFYSWDGEPIVDVYYIKEYSFLANYTEVTTRFYLIYTLLILVLITTFIIFFLQLINIPLNVVAKILETENLEHLRELENSPKIFRDIALLISGFFKQRDELKEEVMIRKATEQALEEHKRIYSTLLNNLPGGAFRCLDDQDWTMLFMSNGFDRFVGCSIKELMLQADFSFEKLIHPDDRQRVRQEIKKHIESKKPYELVYRLLDVYGTPHWVLERGEGIFNEQGGFKYIEGFIADVTKQKEGSEHYKTLFINSSVSMLIVDPVSGQIIDANKSAATFYGYDRDEMCAMNIDQINTITIKEVSSTVRGAKAGPDHHFIFRHRLKDGTLRDVETFSIPITINSYEYVYSIILDVTDRILAEKQIAANQEFLNNMFNTIQDGILVVDLDYNILAANHTINKWYSIDETLVGFKCYEKLSENKQICTSCPVRKAMETGELHKDTMEITMGNGKTYFREHYAYPMKDSNGNTISVLQYIRDNTERQKMEEELLKVEKLESLGTLAAGIAHDFNNILNGLFGYIEMAKINFNTPEKVHSYLTSALGIYERAKNLTKQLSSFTVEGCIETAPTSIKELLSDTVNFALSGSNVRANIVMPDDLWTCNIDKNQIGQVIDNLVINARQAMPSGGIIKLEGVNIPNEEAPNWKKEGQNYVRIVITDTGAGIPENFLKNIFDPFFTTKQKGSGLGLATSYSIINKHKGHIEVSSKLGVGTTFTIYLPAIDIGAEQ
ncbi:MAG: PAS domain S-box protein [Candidatus Cloacimonadia bacterium]